MFYDIFAQAWADIRILRQEGDLVCLYAFHFLYIFMPFLFTFSYLFAAVIDLLPSLLAAQKLLRSITETGNFCHGVATCSGRKFCSEFSNQISEHFNAYFRLHRADHFDLGITGNIADIE